MKVILINGSPNENGCTYTALKEIESKLIENEIETEMFWVGNKAISGCIGCQACFKTGKCFIDDNVNIFIEKAKEVDGFIFGSPVHFAACSGFLSCFMDRVFYKRKKVFSNKLASSIVTCRRGGSTAALDEINKYFSLSNMPIVSGGYWNMVHGNTPEEVVKDEEGMQNMRHLGNNMSWLLKCVEAGRNTGVELPKNEKTILTNFIR